MERRYFTDVLRKAQIDIKREYNRLYFMFYENDIGEGYERYTLRDACNDAFDRFPERGTCISLYDFENTHGFIFKQSSKNFDLNYLVNFCEYAYNLGKL